MKSVYLDNAATTAILPEVVDVMTKVLTETYGNPSSTHNYGRNAKAIVEQARKTNRKSSNEFFCKPYQLQSWTPPGRARL